jgi:hypothetical protein
MDMTFTDACRGNLDKLGLSMHLMNGGATTIAQSRTMLTMEPL